MVLVFEVSPIQRARGRSVVQAAAYRSARCLYDARREQTFDYSAKADVLASEMLAPEGVLQDLLDRERFWNQVEAHARRRDATLAREIILGFPAELPVERAIGAARDYARDNLVGLGRVVDFNFHSPTGKRLNPHAHLLFTTRPVEGDEAEGLRFGRVDVVSSGPGWIWRQRRVFADLLNVELALAGLDRREDPRTFKSRGVDLPRLFRIRGVPVEPEPASPISTLTVERQALRAAALDLILRDPTRALTAVSQERGSFTRADLERFLRRYGEDDVHRSEALSAILAHKDCVRLGRNDIGVVVFAARAAIDREARLIRRTRALASKVQAPPGDDVTPPGALILKGEAEALEARLRGEGFLGEGVTVVAPSARQAAAFTGRTGVPATHRSFLAAASPTAGGRRWLFLDGPRLDVEALEAALAVRDAGAPVIVTEDPGRPAVGAAGGLWRRFAAALGGLDIEGPFGGAAQGRGPGDDVWSDERSAYASARLFTPEPEISSAIRQRRQDEHRELETRALARALRRYVAVTTTLQARVGAEGDLRDTASGDDARRLRRAHERLSGVWGGDPDVLRKAPARLEDLIELGAGVDAVTAAGERLISRRDGPSL